LPYLCLALAPYVCIGGWLSVHESGYSAAGYGFAAGASCLVIAWLGRTFARAYLLHFPVFTIALVAAAYTLTIGQLPGYPVAFVLETTTWEEIKGFLATPEEQHLVLGLTVTVAAYLGLAWWLPVRTPLVPVSRNTRWSIIGLVAALSVIALGSPEKFIEGVVASPIIGPVEFIVGPLSSANASINGVMQRKRTYGASRHGGPEVHILIVGESSRRDSWSLYGYGRPTTPHLDSLRDELIVFTRALADANLTVYAVPMILTGMNPPAFTFTAIHGNLVDLAAEAGYRTAWLVNQDAGISHLVGMRAAQQYYSQTSPRPAYIVYQPDGVLLSELSKTLADSHQSLFVGLHVYGSHSPYRDRYPDSFVHFSRGGVGATPGGKRAAQLVNDYDDAILYTDWFLGQVIERVRQLHVPATITYLSDHGEELDALDGRAGHGQGDYSPAAFRIPAFVWMNSLYRDTHPQQARELTAHAADEIRSHDFFFLLAAMMQIEWNDATESRSPLSSSFTPDLKSGFFAGANLVNVSQPFSPAVQPLQ